jgi:hypothetical protein
MPREMKTADELYMGWNEFNEPGGDFVRRVMTEARTATLVEARDACVEEQRKFDIVARDAPRSVEGMYQSNRALVAANGAAQCIRRLSAMIGAAMITSGEAAGGNNDTAEKVRGRND